MPDNVLATEYIELSATGDLDAKLASVRKELEAADQSLGKASTGFRTFFVEKVGLTKRLLEAQKEMAKAEGSLYDTGPYQRYVRAHVELTAQLSANKGKSAVMDKAAQVKYQGTGEGQANLKLLADQEKQLKKLGETDAWQKQVADQGLVTASLGRMTEKLKEVQAAASIAFGVGAAGIGGMAAAASPEIFSSLTDSVQLVAGAIGTSFLPYIVEACGWLQNLADEIREMDPAVMRQYASWAMWGVGIAGGIVVLPRLLTLLRAVSMTLGPLNTGLIMMGIGSRKATMDMTLLATTTRTSSLSFVALGTSIRGAGAAMNTFIMANPATAILGVAAAVLTLSGAFGAAGGGIDELLNRLDRLEQDRRHLEEGGALSPQQYARDVDEATRTDINRATTPADQRAVAGFYAQQAEQRVREAEQREGQAQRTEQELNRLQNQPWTNNRAANRENAIFQQMGLGERMNVAPGQEVYLSQAEQERLRRQQALRAQLPDLRGESLEQTDIEKILKVIRGDQTTSAARLQALRYVERNGVPTGRDPRLHRPHVDTQGGDIAGQWGRLQQAALKRDDLEQERFQQQLTNWEQNRNALERNTSALERNTNAPSSAADRDYLINTLGYEPGSWIDQVMGGS